MKTAFKKGQLVTYFCDWDRKGTVCYVHAVVRSCGQKRLLLMSPEKGKADFLLGREFAPLVGCVDCEGHRRPGGVFPRMTDEESQSVGMHMAAGLLAAYHEEAAADEDRRAQLHEPRVEAYEAP